MGARFDDARHVAARHGWRAGQADRPDRDHFPHPSLRDERRCGDRGICFVRRSSPARRRCHFHRHRARCRTATSYSWDRTANSSSLDRSAALRSFLPASSGRCLAAVKADSGRPGRAAGEFPSLPADGRNSLRALSAETDIPFAADAARVPGHLRPSRPDGDPARLAGCASMATPTACATCYPENTPPAIRLRREQLLQVALLPPPVSFRPAIFWQTGWSNGACRADKFVVIENGLRACAGKREDRVPRRRQALEFRLFRADHAVQGRRHAAGHDRAAGQAARHREEKIRIKVYGNMIGQDPEFIARFKKIVRYPSASRITPARMTTPMCII